MRITTLLVTLLSCSCGGPAFEGDLFNPEDAGADRAQINDAVFPDADVPDTTPDAAPEAASDAAPDPCDQCVCNKSGELCPDQTNHCMPDVNGYRSCCKCPAECLKPAPSCNWYPATKLWCCQ